MSTRVIPERKVKIVAKLCKCFLEYKQVIVCKLDNVSTGQIQNARKILRNRENPGEMVIGKNTLIHKAIDWVSTRPKKSDPNFEIREALGHRPEIAALKEKIVLNVGLIFSDDDYNPLRTLIENEVIEMPAKAGVLAPCDVALPAGPTGIDAGKIDIFHKLNIPVKISRAAIEITKEFPIISKNEKVTEAAALMCRTLNLTPFRYNLSFKYVFLPNGQIIDEDIICMDPESILGFFQTSVQVLTGLSLATNTPNFLSGPHMVANAFRGLLALGISSGHTFAELEAAQAAKDNAPAAGAEGEEKAADAPEEEEEDEGDVSAGNLFGDSDSSSDED